MIPLICDICGEVYAKRNGFKVVQEDFNLNNDDSFKLDICSAICLMEFAQKQIDFEAKRRVRKEKKVKKETDPFKDISQSQAAK